MKKILVNKLKNTCTKRHKYNLSIIFVNFCQSSNYFFNSPKYKRSNSINDNVKICILDLSRNR